MHSGNRMRRLKQLICDIEEPAALCTCSSLVSSGIMDNKMDVYL